MYIRNILTFWERLNPQSEDENEYWEKCKANKTMKYIKHRKPNKKKNVNKWECEWKQKGAGEKKKTEWMRAGHKENWYIPNIWLLFIFFCGRKVTRKKWRNPVQFEYIQQENTR